MNDELAIHLSLPFDNQHKEKVAVLEEVAEWLSDQLEETIAPSLIVSGIKEREAVGSTGFGDGFAIPHGQVPKLMHPVLAIIRLEQPVNWEAMDDEKVDHLLIILVPVDKANQTHLELLSTLAYHLIDQDTKHRLKTIKEPIEMRGFIKSLFERGR